MTAPRPRRSIARALVLSAAAGAAVYVGFACYVGAGQVKTELARFGWSAAACALALAALNYTLRFVKWEMYLRRLGVRIPLGDSLRIFLAGFSLTVTPGKVGEVLKAYLLREAEGVPMARTAPIVVAERLSDLIGLIALAVTGVGMLGGGTRVLWVAGALVAGILAVVSSRPLVHAIINASGKLPLLGKLTPKLHEFYDSTAVLLRPTPLVLATLISIAAWGSECVAFYLVLRAFPGVHASLSLCTFIYAAMTIAGALSFLPGGLGVQEGGMVALLISTTHGVDRATAFAATFVTRLCTLWFAVAIGIVALGLIERRRGSVDLTTLQSATQ